MQKCRSDVFEFSCKFKEPSGQDRTAAEGNYVAEATRCRSLSYFRKSISLMEETDVIK